jgi:hypothetical protein
MEEKLNDRGNAVDLRTLRRGFVFRDRLVNKIFRNETFAPPLAMPLVYPSYH